MSVWRRRQPPEKRATYVVQSQAMPYITGDYSAVDLSSSLASMQAVACWSSIDLIASLVSEMPIDLFRGTSEVHEQIDPPSTLLDPGGEGYGVQDWLWQALLSCLTSGNLVGEIINRDPRSGFPTQVQLATPDGTDVWRDNNGAPVWTVGGHRVEDPRDVWHRRAYPVSGSILGLSPIEYHATTLGLTIAVKRFGAGYFRDNATPTGMLVNEEEELNSTSAKTVKQRFMAALRGVREPLVLGRGWRYQQLSIAPEESQFLETNQFSAAECARIYGPGLAEILGYESGSSMTYATVEGRSTHLLVYAVGKWITRAERWLTSLTPRGQFVKLNRKSLLATTNLERFRAYEIALRNKWMVPNEVRKTEDMEPVEWGDEPISATEAAPSNEGVDVPVGMGGSAA